MTIEIAELRGTNVKYLLDEITMTKFDQFRSPESRNNFATSNKTKAFNSVKIGVLNSHDASIGKQLFGVVVNQLSVNLIIIVIKYL